ncbi:DUF3950 domain-containing protein [Alteromonas sp. RKMC-009]|nr:DUF3950 domain-containing protein [Alteromonas sp. RKMC-009]
MQERNSPKRSDERSGSTRKNIRFEDSLLERVEDNRQSTSESFSEWVKTACELRLQQK